jgi:CDP-diglyceride synthetase
MMKIAAIVMVILALVIGIVPQFSDCESHGRSLTLADGRQIPMKCHWTAQAEIGLAVPLFVTGALMTTSRRKDTLRSQSLLGVVLGLFVILLPTALIGVCANPEMICNAFMKPFLILSGSLVIAISLFGLVRSFQAKEEWLLQGKGGMV